MSRKFRYVRADGSYAARWRPVPTSGIGQPSKRARELLGEGYSLQIRTALPARAFRKKKR